MTTKNNTPLFYSSMNNNDEQLFADEQIQRYDADTIKNRFGDNWRSYASNVREVKQPDGTIVREYIIEDPTLLQEIKPSADSTSSTTGSDDEQQISKSKFAQIKAKFEQKSFTNVMASPSSSSVASSQTATTRRSSNRQLDEFNARNRRDSNDSLAHNRNNPDIPHASTITSNSQQSRSVSNTSFRRVNSADEADEEVQRIHRQGNELRQHQSTLTPISSIAESSQQQQLPPSNVQYEVVDEDGNPMVIDDVQDLIKMAGVTAREVPQPDGTLVREYVIDDPTILSKFQSQQTQPRIPQDHIPPPPPRIPAKQSMLFRQEPLHNEPPPSINLQQIRTIEPQRRYEFITTSGKRIEFMITSLGVDEPDVHELANELNARLLPSNSSQQQFTLPKPWHPAVDLTQREPPNRQRTGSDHQPPPNAYNPNFPQGLPIQPDLARSASYGGLNQPNFQQQFAPVFAEPIIDWSAVRQQDPHGQVDPQLIQQFITQKHQNGSFQSSAQFLPEQPPPPPPPQPTSMAPPMNSPSRNNQPIYYPQTLAYPYQGQQQHGVRILPNNSSSDYNYHHHQQQQQIPNGHTRI